MTMDRYELQDAFERWVDALDHSVPPQWAQPDEPLRWLEQAAEAELGALIERAGDAGIEQPRGGLLVIVTGTSPQPCLLSTLWHRPERVIVAASRDGTGQRYAGQLESAIRELPEESRPSVLESVRFPPDDPVATFSCLRQRLERHYLEHPEDRQRTIIDITGGKKPMVSSAFFLAAWYDRPAVYMDAEYHPQARLPVPCTAAYKRLGNPGVVLGLYTLREAERLWRARNYRASQELLADAADRISAGEPGRRGAVDEACRLAQGVMSWEELHYDAALEVAPTGLPEAVQHLGRRWSELRDQAKSPRDWHALLRRDPWHLLLHMVDVVQWVRRRTDRDHRSSFIRLYSLGEVAFGLALAVAWDKGELKSEPAVQGAFNEKVWPRLRDGAAPGLLTKGTAKDKNKTVWSVPRLSEAAPWAEPEWHDLRVAAAHGLAIIELRHVERILEAIDGLLRGVAGRVGTAKDPDGNDVDMGTAVAGWLESECPWFTPPPFPIGDGG